MLFCSPAFAQQALSGKVVDVSGQPVVGATVLVEGTNNGVVTDMNGAFTINARDNVPVLVSILGYNDARVNLRNGVVITLSENVEMLEETVVVGYGSIKKKDLTGSVASVSTEDLVRGAQTNAAGALQGVLPGVQIQRSNNKPGGTFNILIRGLNTISGSTSPLVVVDGVQGASLSNINPDDIERIDVLKDASSTAIYGSRATNGVVLVTTKRGIIGKPTIDYSGYVGVRQYTNMPEMMSGSEYVQLAREAARAGNKNEYKDDSQIFTASELKAIEDGNYFNWVDALTHPALMTNHTVSARGGDKITVYALSAGYYYEDGMIEPQEYSRYNLRTAVDVHPVDFVKFGINLYGTHTMRDTGNSDVLQDAIRMRPTYHPTNLVKGTEEWSFSNGQYNPLVAVKNEWNMTKSYNFIGNVYLEFLPAKGLLLKTTFSPDYQINEIGQYRGTYTKANKGANKATSNYAKNSSMNWVWDNQISYLMERGLHRVDVTGVFSMLQTKYEALRGIGNGLAYNSLWYNLGGGANSNTSSSGYTQTNLMSYLARVNYSYADKYYVTSSIRFDGSSKLAENNKWGSFASAAVAWRISGEPFMQDVGWINNLKLRLSFGQSGNDNVSAYQTMGSISGAKQYTFGTTESIGYVPGNLRNLDLGWERTNEYNIGLDYGFFHDRISGSIEYYDRITHDLIMNKTVPVTTGYSSVKANVGTVRNNGVEVLLNTINVKTSDFFWRTSINVSFNKNRIVDLQYKEDLTSRGPAFEGMEGDYSNLWIIGQPIDINYSLRTDGIWQSDEAEEAAKYGCKSGQFKPLDRTGDGKITDADRFINGKRTPDFIGGMTNTFSYKNFDLSFQISFQSGAILRNQYLVSFAYEGNAMNFNNLRYNYWTPENPSNEHPQPSNYGTYSNYRSSIWGNNENKATSSHRLSKMDYLKLNYVTLGYNFSKLLLQKIHMKNLRIYATVQNPYILCDKYVFDPEQVTASINGTDFMTCNLIFGINIGL
ncbi:MAG: SusC/RagA family TonB-linked outer membrane protein [Candidatus Cryptobacteroides sp.]